MKWEYIGGGLLGVYLVTKASDNSVEVPYAPTDNSGAMVNHLEQGIAEILSIPINVVGKMFEEIELPWYNPKTYATLLILTYFYLVVIRTSNTKYSKNRATWTKARGGGWSRDTY